MNKAVFITARTDSSRLRDKALLPILDRPTIELVMARAKRVANADIIVLCTTDRPIDDGLVEISRRMGIQHFRGSLEDKLNRWLNAATKYSVDLFVTMDGDDLLCDFELMSLGLDQMLKSGCDFIRSPVGLTCGAFTYCIRTDALRMACDMKGTDDTEMMWVYFENTGMFDVRELEISDPIFFDDRIRLTLDYPEDFRFFTEVFRHFTCNQNDVPLREILHFLKSRPDLIDINAFRQKDFAENQKRRTKLVLKEEVISEG